MTCKTHRIWHIMLPMSLISKHGHSLTTQMELVTVVHGTVRCNTHPKQIAIAMCTCMTFDDINGNKAM